MTGYEIMFFSDGPRPVLRGWRNSEREAMDFAGKELRARLGGAYNAAIWNSCPSCFYCLYVNDQDEIFIMTDPCILTREKAARLRRKPIA